MVTATKIGSDTVKTAFKKEVHKAAKPTRWLVGKKNAEKTMKPKPMPDVTWMNGIWNCYLKQSCA